MRRFRWIGLGSLVGVVAGYLAPILYSMLIVRENNPQIGLVSVFVGVPTGAIVGGIAGALLSVVSRADPPGGS